MMRALNYQSSNAVRIFLRCAHTEMCHQRDIYILKPLEHILILLFTLSSRDLFVYIIVCAGKFCILFMNASTVTHVSKMHEC